MVWSESCRGISQYCDMRVHTAGIYSSSVLLGFSFSWWSAIPEAWRAMECLYSCRITSVSGRKGVRCYQHSWDMRNHVRIIPHWENWYRGPSNELCGAHLCGVSVDSLHVTWYTVSPARSKSLPSWATNFKHSWGRIGEYCDWLLKGQVVWRPMKLLSYSHKCVCHFEARLVKILESILDKI